MGARSPDLLLPLLSSNSPVTLDQLQSALGQVSLRTTSRYLRQIRYVRSYNHNGRFYTLRDRARFDRFGLFSLGDAHFSRDGSLTKTVRRLISESVDGFTARELSGLLHVSVRPFLLAAVRRQRARRQRLGGVYVYFANGPSGDRQLRARRQRLADREAARLANTLEPQLIIDVLLVLVRHPGALPGEVARRLQHHSPPIRRPQVQAVFDRFELLEDGQKRGSGVR